MMMVTMGAFTPPLPPEHFGLERYETSTGFEAIRCMLCLRGFHRERESPGARIAQLTIKVSRRHECVSHR